MTKVNIYLKTNGALTVNDERMRFHFLGLRKTKDAAEFKEMINEIRKEIETYRNKGYEHVSFEMVAEDGDRISLFEENQTEASTTWIAQGFGKNSEYAKKKAAYHRLKMGTQE